MMISSVVLVYRVYAKRWNHIFHILSGFADSQANQININVPLRALTFLSHILKEFLRFFYYRSTRSLQPEATTK